MANLFDYLEEYGHVPFEESSFNEADNLALCQLAYCDLIGVVPSFDSRRSVTLNRAWCSYIARHGAPVHKNERLFGALADTERFGQVRLFAFDERLDRFAHEQFAAYSAILPDGTVFVVYRGTNDYLSGWRENFMMSYEVVGAQVDAQRYLDRIGHVTSGFLHVGGHSKGGNLAAYAAAFCSRKTRGRIRHVWCNDPPGFVREVVDFAAFKPVIARMHLFVPEFCVVAGIMEQVMKPAVIQSAQNRYLQHDALSWQIEGTKLARSQAVSPECLRVRRVFYRLIYTRSRTERVEIVNDLFDAISLAGIEMISDFANGGLRTAQRVMVQLRTCERQTRDAVWEVLVSLAGEELSCAVTGAVARVAHASPLARAVLVTAGILGAVLGVARLGKLKPAA